MLTAAEPFLCPQLSAGAPPDPLLDPLDALSDTLKDIKPKPQPVPAEPKNVVKVGGVEGVGKGSASRFGSSDWSGLCRRKRRLKRG